jgi:hypothetical protein
MLIAHVWMMVGHDLNMKNRVILSVRLKRHKNITIVYGFYDGYGGWGARHDGMVWGGVMMILGIAIDQLYGLYGKLTQEPLGSQARYIEERYAWRHRQKNSKKRKDIASTNLLTYSVSPVIKNLWNNYH